MYFKYFFDPRLAHASYLVACQKTGDAIVIDPGLDVQQYLDTARLEKFRITSVAETHIHADYVSGARELAERVGARLLLSDEGPPEWKYLYAGRYDHLLLKDGDTFTVGNVDFRVMFTPGHTPEGISFLLTDRGGGATRPMGIFTGDFVFVGSIGRPDLLERVAGVGNSAEPGARQLFQSIGRFRSLPDWLQVWPTHGAGSACGKGLGAVPASTVGYEKLFNPALQFSDEEAFVEYILSEQPEAPPYFALMKRLNREGPPPRDLSRVPEPLPANQAREATRNTQVIDTSPATTFGKGHLARTTNIPLSRLAQWGGWLIDYSQPVGLIASRNEAAEAFRVLGKIGVDRFAGWFDSDELSRTGLKNESIPEKRAEAIHHQVQAGEVVLLDVRGRSEWNRGHIPGAEHAFLGTLPARLEGFERDRTIVFQCQSGTRSMIAASLARQAGFKDVINLEGGFEAWQRAGLPVETSVTVAAGHRE